MAGLFRVARQARVCFPRLYQHTPSWRLSAKQLNLPVLSSTFARTYATTEKVTKSPSKSSASPKKTTTKATKKTTKKSTKKSTKKPKSKKVATKKPTKKLTPKQKASRKKKEEREAVKALKAEALSIPKQLPTNSFAVFLSGRKGGLAENSVVFKSLPTAELEKLQEQAKSNIASNKGAYEHWVKSHSPLEIKLANDSRRKLRRRGSKKYPRIQDDRQVKGTMTAYMLFATDKFLGGEFKNLSAKERITQIARSWKQSPASEREKYDRLSQGDKQRYAEEYKAVYGEAPQSSTAQKATES